MESELQALYNVLSFYKKSLIKNLNKIENNLLQLVHDGDTPKKKYQLSIQIVGMFPQYSRMLHIVEGLVEDLKTKLAGLECDCEPEKEFQVTNPFRQSPEPENESFFESESTLVNEEERAEISTIPKVFDAHIASSSRNFKQEVVDSEVQNEIFDTTPVLKPQDECFNIRETSTSFTQTLDTIKLENSVLNEDFQGVDTLPDKQEGAENCLLLNDPIEVKRLFDNFNSLDNYPDKFKVFSSTLVEFKPNTSSGKAEISSCENSFRTPPETNIEDNSMIDPNPPLSPPLNNFNFQEKPRELNPDPPPRNENLVLTPTKKKKKSKTKNNSDFTNFEYFPPQNLPEPPPIQKQRHVTFKIDEPKPSEENSAVRKAMQLPPYNWREEAQRLFQNQTMRKTFKWVSAPAQKRSSGKKTKEKCSIFNIVDNDLSVRQSCVFCHVESPSEFYIRTDQELFEKLENALNEDMNQEQYVVNKFSKKLDAKNSLGNFCFGYLSTRRKWFRLEVLDWMLDESDRIFVQMIDYGEKFVWSFSQLKHMSEFYAMIPKMAIKCHFAGIFSTNIQNKTKWPKSSTDFLIDLVEMKKMTKFMTIYVHKDGNSYGVDLQKENCDGYILGRILVNNGHAFEVQIVEDDFLNSLDEGDLEDKIDHQVMLPLSGAEVTILITGYINTCHFYAQIVPNEDFTNLLEVMNTTKTKPFKSLPKISQHLVVKQDANFFRATCVSHIDEDTIEVFLVDFGKIITAKIEDIRHMKEEFLSVPFQAMECILHDCQENTKTTRDSSRKFFNFCMDMRKFKALVVESGEPLKLRIWDPHHMDMGFVLKQCGIGEDRVDLQTSCIVTCG